MRIFIAILILMLSAIHSGAQCPFDKKVKRILFLGNSITYDGRFVSQIETFFVQHYPACEYEFINVGLPSETVSGLSEEGHAGGKFPRPDLHERLSRVLALTRPDLVFACYGMNDGIYQPLNAQRFRAFKDGISWLHHMLDSSGVEQIVHITPPVHDDTTLRTKGYNKVLDAYAEWLVSFGKKQNWNVIDLHSEMTRALNDSIAINKNFRFAPDQVHPNDQGHWFMARTILRGMGQEVKMNPQMELENDDLHKQLYELVRKRQAFMKDAWLTATGHQRPQMKQGLAMDEARKQYDQLGSQIKGLQNKIAPH